MNLNINIHERDWESLNTTAMVERQSQITQKKTKDMLWPLQHQKMKEVLPDMVSVCVWLSSPTLTAAFKSSVRWDAVGSGTQRVQAVQGVVSPVSASASSSSSQLIELLSLWVPAISKTAVSDVAAFLTGRFLESLSYTHKHTQSDNRVPITIFSSTVCVVHEGSPM